MGNSASRLTAVAVVFCAVFLLLFGEPADIAVLALRFGGDPLATLMLIAPPAAIVVAGRGIVRARAHDRQMREGLKAQRQAQTLAKRDSLTGLLNRRGFIEGIGQLAHLAERRGNALALMIIDLDEFKMVNDLHGHHTGDQLLKVVGERISTYLPPDALGARLGGDEFAIAFDFQSSFPIVPEGVARQVVDALAEPIIVDELQLFVGASLGLASSELPAGQVNALLRQADVAMYRAKQSGRNCFAWFDESMERDLRQRGELETELRDAIGQGQIIPYYEPQISLIDGSIAGFEVLARWRHPARGIVAPSEFIPIAEERGMIGDLSENLMRQAFADALKWGGDHILSINISPMQLRDPRLAQKVLKALVEAGFPPHRLEIEITETAMLGDMATAKAVVASLKNQGVRLALDDFGTGYSSLHHLRALPFDKIKIDRSFISSIQENTESAAIVRTVLSLGQSLNVDVTAEGVETVEIETALRALNCPNGQGWLYSKPMPQADVLELLQSETAATADRRLA